MQSPSSGGILLLLAGRKRSGPLSHRFLNLSIGSEKEVFSGPERVPAAAIIGLLRQPTRPLRAAA